ncbi:MAG: VTT domain-containing protein [Bacteroidales bacterium OttesenSCG-928-I14]|jgi:membrane-associated protein|nr:VTT domain-containing protein [Bacteroidales bacterium OttesenSCG-928-I14]
MLFFNFITHIDNHLDELIKQYGICVYLILFITIFCETGLVIIPFLPGDSLIFATGVLAAKNTLSLNINNILLLISFAAILGNTCNYMIGRFFGQKIFLSCNYKLMFLKSTYNFYRKYGGKTIIFSRFIPIIRTFAPFVAGIIKMNYTHFLICNILGGILWVTVFLYTGYFFGQFKFIKTHFDLLIIILIFTPLLLGIVKILKQKN